MKLKSFFDKSDIGSKSKKRKYNDSFTNEEKNKNINNFNSHNKKLRSFNSDDRSIYPIDHNVKKKTKPAITDGQSSNSKDSELLQVVYNKKDYEEILQNYVAKEDPVEEVTSKISKKQLAKLQRIKKKKESSLPAKHPDAEERTIFVGNVNVGTKKGTLKKLFSKYGEIDTIRFRGVPVEKMNMSRKEAVATKRFHSGRQSLFAFVRFKDVSSVEKALVENGEVFEGLHIRVDRATQTAQKDKHSIFVGNLSWEANEEDLWQFFKGCGKITSVRIVRSSVTGAGKGFAYVSFESNDGIEMALHLDGKTLMNRQLRIKKTAKKVKEKIVKVKRKSGVASILEGKKKVKMNVSFLKKDKPQLMKKKIKEKHGKRKALQAQNVVTPVGKFSGNKAVEDGKVIKKDKKRKRTQNERKKFALAKKLGNTN